MARCAAICPMSWIARWACCMAGLRGSHPRCANATVSMAYRVRMARTMILSNPTGRAIRLEILAGDEAAMALTIGAHASVDLGKYERALAQLLEASQASEGGSHDTGADQQQ